MAYDLVCDLWTIDLKSNVKLWSVKMFGTHPVWWIVILKYGSHGHAMQVLSKNVTKHKNLHIIFNKIDQRLGFLKSFDQVINDNIRRALCSKWFITYHQK